MQQTPPLRSRARTLVLVPLAVIAAGTTLAGLTPGVALGRSQSCGCTGIDDLGFRQHLHHQPATAVPRLVGQDTAAALQEVVGLLMGDPRTHWSEVSLDRVRRYLVDLDEIMRRTEVEEVVSDDRLELRLGGQAATLAALRRQVPGHIVSLNGFRGWTLETEDLERGLRLTVRVQNESELEVARAVGFFGLMASGVHRPHHLLAIARGVEDTGGAPGR